MVGAEKLELCRFGEAGTPDDETVDASIPDVDVADVTSGLEESELEAYVASLVIASLTPAALDVTTAPPFKRRRIDPGLALVLLGTLAVVLSSFGVRASTASWPGATGAAASASVPRALASDQRALEIEHVTPAERIVPDLEATRRRETELWRRQSLALHR
jgi:hypothetical protein